ncbi:hypothetical protein RHSIM_Rhsim07G0170400 [Rhododendron simsii]|uniref:Uncharacterized protein n=1 Tax=Rhododendron simsii TaxID=118357 RepID=A0A834GQA5_RHOSS|nr:hypothetical protein RHSIM_Rhsim07G0170400 [Rhododendron simsii]
MSLVAVNVAKPPDGSVPMYGDIVVSIFYKEKPLSMTIMEPFTHKEINHTMVKVMFPSKISPVEPRDLKRMTLYFVSYSSFEFSFDVKANGRLWPNNWIGPEDTETERFISVRCPDVKVDIVTKTGVGTMTGKPLKCKVKAKSV